MGCVDCRYDDGGNHFCIVTGPEYIKNFFSGRRRGVFGSVVSVEGQLCGIGDRQRKRGQAVDEGVAS